MCFKYKPFRRSIQSHSIHSYRKKRAFSFAGVCEQENSFIPGRLPSFQGFLGRTVAQASPDFWEGFSEPSCSQERKSFRLNVRSLPECMRAGPFSV